VTGEWRKLHNKKLHDLYSSPSIMRINEIGGTCITNGGKEECIEVVGGKARGKEAARKTKT
jgi:hypothetical protein